MLSIVLVLLAVISCDAFTSISSHRSHLQQMQMAFNLFGGSSKVSPAIKKLAVITGTTSGLGKATVKSLLKNTGTQNNVL